MCQRHPLSSIPYLTSVLPVLVLTSLLWAVWDPTYITLQKGVVQGRDVRVHGKQKYIVRQTLYNDSVETDAIQILQMSAWISRLLISLVLAFGHRSAFITDYVAPYPRIYLSLSLLIEIAVSLSLLPIPFHAQPLLRPFLHGLFV